MLWKCDILYIFDRKGNQGNASITDTQRRAHQQNGWGVMQVYGFDVATTSQSNELDKLDEKKTLNYVYLLQTVP